MNRKLIFDALSMIDDTYIQESIVCRSDSALSSSERNLKMDRSQHSAKRAKKLIALGIAACLVLSMVITASAANLWGIRDLLGKSGSELPEEAYDYVQTQSDSAQNAEWSCRITESLCDHSNLTVAVAVTCSEKYVIAPIDASPDDSAHAAIGVGSDLTLGEYASSQGKELLFANASLTDNEAFDVIAGMLHFEYISDSHAVLMAHADIDSYEPVTHGICTVHIIDAHGRKTEQILHFDLSEAPVTDFTVFVPVDPNAVAGLCAGEATVTRTPLGISIRMEETITDPDAFGCMEFMCEQFPGIMGGSAMDSDGKWYLEMNGGQGSVTDKLSIQVFNVETGQLMGQIVFEKQ